MIWKETGKLNVLGYVLIGSIVLFAIPLWEVFSNWHDFKGNYLIEREQLQITSGRIIQSSGYTSKQKKTTYFHYLIKYEYFVEGKYFQSDEVTFDRNYRVGAEFAEFYRAKYPLNSLVTVYYDRNNPAFAVLEPESTSAFHIAWLFLLLSTLGFALAGLLIINKLFFAARRTTNPPKRLGKKKTG